MIDIIIPTLNRHDSIKRIIKDLNNQTDKNFSVNIIDQSETPFYNKELTSFKVIIHWTPDIRSPILARNYGVDRTNSNIILFLDDDMIPSSNLIENIHAIFNEYKKPLVVGGISNIRSQTKLEKFIRKILQRGIYKDPRYYYFKNAFDKNFEKIDSFLVTPYISAGILAVNRIALNKNPLPVKFKQHILGGDIYYGMSCIKKNIRVCLSYLLSAEEIPDKQFEFKSIKGFRKIIMSFHSALLVLRINGFKLKNIFHFILRSFLIFLFLLRFIILGIFTKLFRFKI